MKRAKPTAKKGSGPAPRAPATPRARLLLVDDHPLMRAGFAQLINRQDDLEATLEAGSPAEAFALLAKTKVDLLLTDLTMPGRGGIEFIKDVLALYPEQRILVVSMHDETVYAERVLRAGARGYIMKEAGGERFLAAIRQVLRGEVYASEKMALRILSGLANPRPRHSASPIQSLTDREFEVFQLIGRGEGPHDVARQLHLSPKTVDVHRANIKRKLGLKDGVALIHQAVRWVEANRAG